MVLASICPLTLSLFEQTAAYLRYFQESQDWRVIVWAAIFGLACLVPALFVDLARLPSHLYERHGLPDRSRPGDPSRKAGRRNG